MSNIIQQLETEWMAGKTIPEFGPGDTVVVQVRVKEGNRERLQAYEGVVIAKRNRGYHSAFTVRKISHGEGVDTHGCLRSSFWPCRVLGDRQFPFRASVALDSFGVQCISEPRGFGASPDSLGNC